MDFLRFIPHTSVDISLKIVVEWKVGIVRMKGIKTGSLTGGEVVGEVGGMRGKGCAETKTCSQSSIPLWFRQMDGAVRGFSVQMDEGEDLSAKDFVSKHRDTNKRGWTIPLCTSRWTVMVKDRKMTWPPYGPPYVYCCCCCHVCDVSLVFLWKI